MISKIRKMYNKWRTEREIIRHTKGNSSSNTKAKRESKADRVKWMTKENVVYTCSGLLFSLKKEGHFAMSDSIGKPLEHYGKWTMPVTEG